MPFNQVTGQPLSRLRSNRRNGVSVQKMSEGGIAGLDELLKNPNPPPPVAEGPMAGLEQLLAAHKEPETPEENGVRNLTELGFPADMDTGASRAADFIPVIGQLKHILQAGQIGARMGNPEMMHNTVGNALETNLQRGSKQDTFGAEQKISMLSEGGMIDAAEDDDEEDPLDIPDDIREFVEKAHVARQESRPDESWHIKPPEEKESVAPYMRDTEEEEEESPLVAMGLPHFDNGGMTGAPPDDDDDEPDAPMMAGMAPPVASPAPAAMPPAAPPIPVPPAPAMAKPMAPPMAAPLTDQSYMDKANKLLGLGPDQQVGLMKLLGGNAQKAQLGAGLAGIGDAIASGGTLGKVNPGGLKSAEDLIQTKTNEGIQGMQTIRENQGKTQELSDKLQARDPDSPLSKYAQKAYASVGKKIGIDLSHASAALIADVTGKGVEALNTELQNQLKMMSLDLQKQTLDATKTHEKASLDATIANQKAERDEAKRKGQFDAAKELAGQTTGKKFMNFVTPSGRLAQKQLEKTAAGEAPVAPAGTPAGSTGPLGAETVKNGKTYEWSPETGKYHLKQS